MKIDAENERLYNVRAALPDHQQIFTRWADDSAKVRKQLSDAAEIDIAYGSQPLQRLDLFHAAEYNAPVHVFLHGGYWQAMDKSFFSFLAPAFQKAGVSLAIVNYSLCPDVTLDMIAEEISGALLWLSQHGGRYGYDSSKLHLSGHSAGGHLVAMAMADGQVAQLIGSGVSISGLFDLRPLVTTSINEKLGLDELSARQNSPLFKSPLTSAPLLLCVGEHESRGFHWQSDLLENEWGKRMSKLEHLKLPGCNHLTAIDQFADPRSDIFQATISLSKI